MNSQRSNQVPANRKLSEEKARLMKQKRLLDILKIAVGATGALLAGVIIWVAVKNTGVSEKNKGEGPTPAPSVHAVVPGENEGPTPKPSAPAHGSTNENREGSGTVSTAYTFGTQTGSETDPDENLGDGETPAPQASGSVYMSGGTSTPGVEFTPTPTPTPEPSSAPEPTPTAYHDPMPTPKPVKLDHKYEIEVDKSKQVVTIYTVGETGYYDLIVKQFLCSTGHCDKVEDGWYKIGDKYRWKEMGNGSYAQYASRISGPYLFHSAGYYKAKVNQLKVRYYENLGTNASSGCIRLTAGDAYWIYNNCPKGTPIHVITSGERDEELIEALRPPALISQQYDPTDPETPEKYRYKPETEPTPDPTPVPGVTPAPTPSWTVHPTLKAWGYC